MKKILYMIVWESQNYTESVYVSHINELAEILLNHSQQLGLPTLIFRKEER